MTQNEIAVALREYGVEVTQATINRIKTGEIKRTGFDIGVALLRLHQRVVTNTANGAPGQAA